MSFISSLDPVDLERLREIVRRVYWKKQKARHKTDYEVDKFIEAIGPGVQESLIKSLVDNKLSEPRSFYHE